MKQFRPCLLGRAFTLMTDHASLQWLSVQKMESLLCHWALAMQEHSFDIVYCKGTENTNVDSLSHNPVSDSQIVAIASSQSITADIQRAQLNDLVIKQIHDTLSNLPNTKPTNSIWTQPLFKRYLQIWHQLPIVDGVVCLPHIATSLGYLNNLLQYHYYQTPYTSQQSISHIIFPHPGIKGLLKGYDDFNKLLIG